MNLIALLLAAILTMGAVTTTSETSEARANIIEIGATSSAETPSDETSEARANIIEIGAQSQ